MSTRSFRFPSWLLAAALLCVMPILAGCGGGAAAILALLVDNLDVATVALRVDNLNPGCQIVDGAWDTADTTDGNGSWGPDFLYLHSSDPAGHVRFTANVATLGEYNVSIYWSADPNRTTDQPVVVHDALGQDTTYHVNLQQHGNMWYLLGPHTMGPAGCYVEFSNQTAAEGYCNADAIQLTTGGFQIIDGVWGTADTTDGNGCWGPDFRYLHSGDPAGHARFTANVTPQGEYNVWIYWSADPNRTTDQPVVVHDALGVNTTYHVNLQQHGHTWYLLGPHTMGPAGCYVEFTNVLAAEGYCNADAIRLTQ